MIIRTYRHLRRKLRVIAFSAASSPAPATGYGNNYGRDYGGVI